MQFHDLILRPVIKGSTFMSVLDMASGFYQVGVRVMAFNEFQQYFSYIMAVSFISGENHRPVAHHRQNLSHNFVSSAPRH